MTIEAPPFWDEMQARPMRPAPARPGRSADLQLADGTARSIRKSDLRMLRRVHGEGYLVLPEAQAAERAAARRLRKAGLLRAVRRRSGDGCIYVLSGAGVRAVDAARSPHDA